LLLLVVVVGVLPLLLQLLVMAMKPVLTFPDEYEDGDDPIDG
jgi:hypothetical protein